jgi:VirK protein
MPGPYRNGTGFQTEAGPNARLSYFKIDWVGIIVSMGVCSPWLVHSATADELSPDFVAFEKAVLDGKDFRMVIDMSACQVHGTDKSGPPVRGSIRFDAYMIQRDDTIAFSTTHFTVRDDKTVASEFLSYRVYPTGKVGVRTIILNPVTDAAIQEAEFDCDIGKGVTFHW